VQRLIHNTQLFANMTQRLPIDRECAWAMTPDLSDKLKQAGCV